MLLHPRWLLLAALAATTLALPVPDETDTSSKLLGSSVVTSVSVVMGEKDVNDTLRKVTDDLPASTVDMLKPDGFQFYTVDDKGQLITRQMTESEIHSIIAAGGGPFPIETQDPQKVSDTPTGEINVADVVQNVQNVLQGELNKPATAMGTVPTIPGHANDEWSSILPSILGGDSESAPVTITETDEPAQVPKQNVTSAPEVLASDEKVQVTSVPEVKPQETTSQKKPEDSERPMIPVPVITADSVHSNTEDTSTTETKPVYEMLNTISADEVKEQRPEVPVAETPSIHLEAPVDSEKPTTPAATVEEELAEIEKIIEETVASTTQEDKTKLGDESTTVFEKMPEMSVTKVDKEPESATIIVPSPTIIVPEADISEDEVEQQTEEDTKKPETMLTELADSVSSMISQVSEAVPSMVPIPQKPDTEELVKRVEDGVTVKSKIPEATTETIEISLTNDKEHEVVMVEIKAPEIPEANSTVKPGNVEEKIEIVLKNGTESGNEVPIVRIDITEAKPTEMDMTNENPNESSVVRIQLTNPTITTINEMIDSAPALETSPVEIEPLSLPEKNAMDGSASQTPASSLIAGNHEETETEIKMPMETTSENKPEQVEVPEEKPEVIKDDETKSSMPELLEVEKTEEKKPEKPVETENLKDQKPVDVTSDKVESVTKNEAEEKTTEASVKIVEPIVEPIVEKVEEPVEETPVTPPEVVVSTSVDVHPTIESPEENAEPIKVEVTTSKSEEKPPSEMAESVKTEAKPEPETPVKDVEIEPVAPLKSDEKPEEEKPSVIKESDPVLPNKPQDKPADETPKPLKSEDKPEAEIHSKETEIKPLKTVIKAEEEMPSKNVESDSVKTEEKPGEELPSKNVESEAVKPEEKPEEEMPSKNVESESVKTEKKPEEELPSKNVETEAVKPEVKPEEELPSKNVETEAVKPEVKPKEELPSKNVETEAVKPEAKPEEEMPTKNVESESVKTEKKPEKELPSKNVEIELVKPEEKPVAETPSKEAETKPTPPLKSEEKPGVETPAQEAEIKPLKSEEKPVEKIPSENIDIESAIPMESEEKPVDKTPSQEVEIKPITPLKSEEKPAEKTPSKEADIEPLKSEEKPVEETPLKDVDSKPTMPLEPVEKVQAEKAEIKPMTKKPVEETLPNEVESKPVLPVEAEEKPVEKTPLKDAESKPMTPLKSDEKLKAEIPVKGAESKPMTPLKSDEKLEAEIPSKDTESKPMTPLKSDEKLEAEIPSKDTLSEPIAPSKPEEKPAEATEPMTPSKAVEETLGKDEESKPMTPLKSEEKPEAEIPSKDVENNSETVINDVPQNLVPVELATPESTQPDKQADHVPDVSTPALKVPEKIETQTVAAVQDTEVTEKQTEVVDVKVEASQTSDSEVEPEVVPTEATKTEKDTAPEIPVKVDSQESVVSEPAKDQVPVPLVRVDVSPEKNQSETESSADKVASPEVPEATEVKVPQVDESLKKTESSTENKVPEVEETTKKTKDPQDSIVESSNVHPVEPAISESSSEAPQTDKVETVVEKTEETIKEPADNKIPEPAVTKVESEEAVKPVVKIETTPAKTQEVRIQVNDTAVLVTQQKIPQKVDDEKKKVEPIAVIEPKKPEIEASSQAPVQTTLAPVSLEQKDKPIVQESVTKTSEQKKPTSDPFLKLGEKKPEETVKTSNLNNKKPEDKWTLIPQSEPYPIVKQQQTTEVNKNEQPSVSLEAHQSSVNLEESIRDLDEDIGEFAKLCNELAFSFWVAANKGLSTARSLALSPFGMTSMLAMVFLGARGPTSGQMNDVLKLDDVVTFNPHLVFQNITDSVNLARGQGIANAAFVRELFADRTKAGRILPFYKERAQQFYDGHIEEVNFATISDLVRRRTNLLIRRQTGGRIRDFVKGNVMTLRSPLAALSANVFQTDCTGASSEGRDGEMYFAVLPAVRQRKLVPVPATVWRSGVLAGYEPGLDATVVSLGGIGSLASTIFLLPGQQGLSAPGDSLDHLERRLLEGAVADGVWDRLLKVLIPRMGLEVQVPKFSHRSVVNATAALKRMGLDELFSRHADLRGVNGIGNDLHLADMLQINLFSTCGDEVITGGRHHVEIYPASPLRGARGDTKSVEDDEETAKTEDDSRARRSLEDKRNAEEQLIEDVGVDRAFRSPLTSANKGKQTDRPILKLDRPFLYFVRHNPTGMILHMGRFNPRLMP